VPSENKTASEWQLSTAVALFVFNRPLSTQRVFDEIRKCRPPRLLVVADGPREGRPTEAEACARTRAVIEQVDWDCELSTNFSETNLGCRNRVSSGLDWVFSREDRAIVLEDDCLPSQSFFRFCDESLERYAMDSRIMQICGFNQFGELPGYPYSYLFSKFGPIWGWASWRRAWANYDVNMSLWPRVKSEHALGFCDTDAEIRWRSALYDRLVSGALDTWDYQWGFAKMINSGLSVVPSRNLVTNIGFGPEATHTTHVLAATPRHELSFPLRPPPWLLRDTAFDRAYLSAVIPTRRRRFVGMARRIVGRLLRQSA
jgi:hypothetical protein